MIDRTFKHVSEMQRAARAALPQQSDHTPTAEDLKRLGLLKPQEKQ
jgi:hypothetical protein